MAAPVNDVAAVLLPTQIPAVPCLLEIKERCLEPHRAESTIAVWAQSKKMPAHRAWSKNLHYNAPTILFTHKIYFFGRFSVHEMNDQVGCVRIYEKPYPGDRFIVGFKNNLAFEIQLRTLDAEEVPLAIRNPENLIQTERLLPFVPGEASGTGKALP